ncbi:MAG TPA: HupE/UreJ family protein [Vicinamibacterales bacterium]
MPEYAASFVSGFAHPLHGADHVVAMLAVGVWGALMGGRAIRMWPIAFVATMLVGFASAAAGIAVPLVEPAILSSIVVLGLLIAFGARAPLRLGAAIIGLFAFFHGHAHGVEAAAASATAYAVGLMVATGALHTAGIGLCRLAGGSMPSVVLRAAGAVATFGGLIAMGALA